MTKPKIVATVFEIFIVILIGNALMEQVGSINPFLGFIIGFIFGIGDFLVSYYKGWGLMALLMEYLPESNSHSFYWIRKT